MLVQFFGTELSVLGLRIFVIPNDGAIPSLYDGAINIVTILLHHGRQNLEPNLAGHTEKCVPLTIDPVLITRLGSQPNIWHFPKNLLHIEFPLRTEQCHSVS